MPYLVCDLDGQKKLFLRKPYRMAHPSKFEGKKPFYWYNIYGNVLYLSDDESKQIANKEIKWEEEPLEISFEQCGYKREDFNNLCEDC